MDTFCAVGTVEQAEQPNYLAEGLATGLSVSAQLQAESKKRNTTQAVKTLITSIAGGYSDVT
eukprot:1152634-Pelagomonas_calceolata.AAC.1